MKLFDLGRKELNNVLDHPLWLEGQQLMLASTLFLDEEYCRLDPRVVEVLKNLPPLEWYTYLKDFSLAHFWLTEKMDKKELQYRQDWINTYRDKKDIEWYVWLHNCEAQALFVSYPLMYLNYPGKYYLLNLPAHRLVSNHRVDEINWSTVTELTTDPKGHCLVDSISQFIKDPRDDYFGWLQPTTFSWTTLISRYWVKPKHIIEWYIDEYEPDYEEELLLWWKKLHTPI